MENKVLLFNSNDEKVGETYTRRARQLVKQQRAFWVDDTQKILKFFPDMENSSDISDIDTDGLAEYDTPTDKKLMKLAKQRVYARYAFNMHRSIVLVVSGFLILIYLLTGGGYFWPVWPILALGLSVAIHWIVYKSVSGDNLNDKIAHEYRQLKYKHSELDD